MPNQISQMNWSCLVQAVIDEMQIMIKLAVNEFLAQRLFPRIAG